jgi:hypothetical protein
MKTIALVVLFLASFLVTAQANPELGGIWVTGPERAAWNARMTELQTTADDLDEAGFRLFVRVKELENELAKKIGNCPNVRPIRFDY